MDKKLLLGLRRYLLPVPPILWRSQVAKNAQNGLQGTRFMSADHHLVRELVVMEIPRQGAPLAPQWIAEKSSLPLERVAQILDELEKHMTFLYRNPQGDVAWAYPVTADVTPHHVTFSSGEQIHAA
jgi:hypothetical protein